MVSILRSQILSVAHSLYLKLSVNVKFYLLLYIQYCNNQELNKVSQELSLNVSSSKKPEFKTSVMGRLDEPRQKRASAFTGPKQ